MAGRRPTGAETGNWAGSGSELEGLKEHAEASDGKRVSVYDSCIFGWGLPQWPKAKAGWPDPSLLKQ